MPLSLHAAFVSGALQMLEANARLIGKAQGWAGEQGLAERELLKANLAPDMLPLAYQFKSCWVHTAHAVARCFQGSFSPHMEPPPFTFAGLTEGMQQAIAELEALDADTLNAIADRPMVFAMGQMRLDFTVQHFLLSFSQPNAYFHAATAYGILRMKGMPLGKRDYLGRLRVSPTA